MSYIDREKLLRCLNDNWLAHTPNDNDEKKVRKLKRVFCKGLDMAFDIVKEFPTSEPEDFVPGSIVTIKKGYARYGFISSEKGAFFIVYASEKEMPIGTIPEGTQDGELNPIIGFNVYCVEQIEALADYFQKFAEHCKEHPEFLEPVKTEQEEKQDEKP